MSKKSVFCIATSRTQADQIVDQLKTTKVSNNDLSVLFPYKGTMHDFTHEKSARAPEGAAAGAGTGGVIGGALGWIAGIGARAIPGAGSFITGGLIGLGIPELEGKRREGKIKEGNLLISVHTGNSEEITRAGEIFTNAGAQDICTAVESSTTKESKATDHAARPSEAAYSHART